MVVKVSVIIPVYNAEAYIGDCIESLLRQTLNECEFIFVNDGSIDRSGQIIESYQTRDRRIRLIDQDNQGVSAARNRGLNFASGEYAGFVDADDYIEKDMFEVLYRAAKEDDCDAVISNFRSDAGGRSVVTRYGFPTNALLIRSFIEAEIVTYFLRADELNTVCTKIYKTNLIRKHGIRFPYKVALGEDGMFNLQFFLHAALAKYIDYTGYHYREVAGSATRNLAGKDYFGRTLEVYRMELPEELIRKAGKEKLQRLKAIKLIHNVMSYIHVYFAPTKELSFRQRYAYIKGMIANPYVREALGIYLRDKYNSLGRYEKFIAAMIRKKSMLGLLCATSYSRFRNGGM